MTFKQIVALLIALCFFIFSTLVSWYEGAQLLDRPWEWKYSAVFSNWLNGEVANARQVMEIDHFIYAAKFAPLFPFVMVSSALVVLFLLAAWLLKGKKTAQKLFVLIMAISFLSASVILSTSPTAGLTIFSQLFGVLGTASIFCVGLTKLKETKIAAEVSRADGSKG